MQNISRLFLFLLALSVILSLCQASVIVITGDAPNHSLIADIDVTIYPTSASNRITLERDSKAELINFPGNNTKNIESDADKLNVFRSGTVVTLQGSDDTWLKTPTTTSAQIIEFKGEVTQGLVITSGQVLLGGMPVILASGIDITGKTVAGHPVIFLKCDILS